MPAIVYWEWDTPHVTEESKMLLKIISKIPSTKGIRILGLEHELELGLPSSHLINVSLNLCCNVRYWINILQSKQVNNKRNKVQNHYKYMFITWPNSRHSSIDWSIYLSRLSNIKCISRNNSTYILILTCLNQKKNITK